MKQKIFRFSCTPSSYDCGDGRHICPAENDVMELGHGALQISQSVSRVVQYALSHNGRGQLHLAYGSEVV